MTTVLTPSVTATLCKIRRAFNRCSSWVHLTFYKSLTKEALSETLTKSTTCKCTFGSACHFSSSMISCQLSRYAGRFERNTLRLVNWFSKEGTQLLTSTSLSAGKYQCCRTVLGSHANETFLKSLAILRSSRDARLAWTL